MTLRSHSPGHAQRGFALLTIMVLVGLTLMTAASAMLWTSNTSHLNQRNNQYMLCVSAAESATEKVLSRVSRDFQSDGQASVYSSLPTYRTLVPTAAEDCYWNGWQFSDGSGNRGRMFAERRTAWGWVELDSAYTGLRGMASTYRVVGTARNPVYSDIIAAVRQDFQIANIPIFQFAIFYGIEMEISCGQNFNITGRVHSNNNLWVLPDSTLTFQSHVTSVGNITFDRMPPDKINRGAPNGTVTYLGEKDSKVAALTLPIGTNNTPDAVHGILEVPPTGESATSPMGRQRYYNKADMILIVSNASVTATSGRFDGFSTVIPAAELNVFVSTNTSFYDYREAKTVKPIDIDVGRLRTWSSTNTSLMNSLGGEVRILYVLDRRALPTSQLGAVRVKNGQQIPASGFTLATERPIYVKGHYNCPNSAHLGTTNTTASLPASLVGDAISFQSQNWVDANSTLTMSSRDAAPTTVNAALLAGIVETATYASYSGGAENFPRFMEDWGSSNISTYNGSMVIMFPSRYATGQWGMGNVYNPPRRNWAFDLNFMDSTKLPPGTPEVRTLIRGQWALATPGTF